MVMVRNGRTRSGRSLQTSDKAFSNGSGRGIGKLAAVMKRRASR